MANFFNNTNKGYTAAAPKMKIMNKEFDFSNFLQKTIDFSDNPEISETNTVGQEKFNKGLLKTIIMAGNGIFEVVDSNYGFSIKNQGGNYVALGASYDSLDNGIFVTKNDAPKIPRVALETVAEWYRRVTEKNGEEAQVVFYFNEYGHDVITNDDDEEFVISEIPGVHFWTDKLFSYTPKQRNSRAHTQVHSSDEWYDIFNRKLGMYVETHSHNSMDAFASGEDEANSGNDGFQLVFGRLNTQNPVMYSWATMNEVMKKGLSQDDLNFILDGQSVTTYDEASNKLIFDKDEFQFEESLFDDWDKQVVVTPAYTQSYAGWNRPVARVKQSTYSGYSGYTSQFARLSSAAELDVVKQALMEYLDESKVNELLVDVFLKGYQLKIEHPYVNENNKHNLVDKTALVGLNFETIRDEIVNSVMENIKK